MIRPFIDSDLAAIHAIQAKCPQAAQWRVEDYHRLARDAAGLILVAAMGGADHEEISGFAAFHRVGEEAELHNLAVDPVHQRMGIARALLAEGLRRMREFGVLSVFLEVRASNQPAAALYASLGFQVIHVRRNYYQNPEDDGLVMRLDINQFHFRLRQ